MYELHTTPSGNVRTVCILRIIWIPKRCFYFSRQSSTRNAYFIPVRGMVLGVVTEKGVRPPMSHGGRCPVGRTGGRARNEIAIFIAAPRQRTYDGNRQCGRLREEQGPQCPPMLGGSAEKGRLEAPCPAATIVTPPPRC